VVFFESGVADYQVLRQGLAANTDAVVLDGGDGLAEMAAWLKGRQGLAAIHVVSHGAPGALELGTAVLDEQALASHQAEVNALGAALAPGGDLLLWGCDVAAGPDGEGFLRDLAKASGANVAASAQPVGSAKLGGGWLLGAEVGNVHTTVPFTEAAREAFPGVLMWLPAPSISMARTKFEATLLGNGQVLVTGGFNGTSLSSAELFRPATDTWSSAAPLLAARFYHSATLLANGKVLVAGGFFGNNALSSAELYDPATDTWSPVGSLGTARWSHTGTLLATGQVLVTGGLATGGSRLSSAELYDPAARSWSPAGFMSDARYLDTATALANGMVLVAGGANATDNLSSADLYMPDGVAPRITTQPVSQTLPAGDTVSFTAAADGTPTPTVQWQVSTDGGVSFSTLDGATSTTLSFTVSLAQNGNQYRAVFTNLAGSAISDAATLAVAPGPASGFVLSGLPSQVTAGDSNPITVTAYDASGNVATGYTGTVVFASTDGNANLPASYTFTTADAGVHTFTGVVLRTAGTRFVLAYDAAQGTVFGVAPVSVNPAAASHFQLLVSAGVASGVPFDVTVVAVDAYGNVDVNYTGTVTFSTTDPDPGVVLPPDYSFTSADAGTVTLAGAVTLITPGGQTLTATDPLTGITGSVFVVF
jgi:hypothetical protein